MISGATGDAFRVLRTQLSAALLARTRHVLHVIELTRRSEALVDPERFRGFLQ